MRRVLLSVAGVVLAGCSPGGRAGSNDLASTEVGRELAAKGSSVIKYKTSADGRHACGVYAAHAGIPHLFSLALGEPEKIDGKLLIQPDIEAAPPERRMEVRRATLTMAGEIMEACSAAGISPPYA